MSSTLSVAVESELETALPGLNLTPDELKRFAGGVVKRSYSAGRRSFVRVIKPTSFS
jgi:hypothetical protein